jgi:hypothetical protein
MEHPEQAVHPHPSIEHDSFALFQHKLINQPKNNFQLLDGILEILKIGN